MKIAILDKIPKKILSELYEQEKHAFYDFSFLPEDEMRKRLFLVEGILFRSRISLDKFFFDTYPHLRVVIRLGAGLDHIDVGYARLKGVKIFSTKGDNADAVGEHAVGLLLSLTKKIYISSRETEKFLWKRFENIGQEIGNLTIGIIGYGNTGQAFARKLSGFSPKILAYDKYKSGFGNGFVKESSWTEIKAQADVLSFHVPLSYETYHLFNRKIIQEFRKPFYLLNLSRGKVVNTKDLLTGICQGKILGAGLDVLEEENFPHISSSMKKLLISLKRTEKVIITPHIGGWTRETYRRRLKKIKEILRKL